MSKVTNTVQIMDNGLIVAPTSTDTRTNALVLPMLSFAKLALPTSIDVGENFDLSYEFCNNTSDTPDSLTAITVTDPILSSSYVTVVSSENISGTIDTVSGSFAVDLSSLGGTLDAGECISATVVMRAISLPPTPDELITTATAVMIGTQPPVTLTSQAGPYVGNGRLTVDKSSTATSPVVRGEQLGYTIKIANVGNIMSTIATGDLVDTIPLDDLTDITLTAPLAPSIIFDGINITNTADIEIQAGASITISYSATVK